MTTKDRPMAQLLRKGYDRRCSREHRHIPLRELAAEMAVLGVKINPDQLSRYLGGSNVPYKDTLYLLEALSKVFKVPLREVVQAARFRPKKGVVYTTQGEYIKRYDKPKLRSTMIDVTMEGECPTTR